MATAAVQTYPAQLERNGKTYAFSTAWKNMAGEMLVWFKQIDQPTTKLVMVDLGDRLVDFDMAQRIGTAFDAGEIKKK